MCGGVGNGGGAGKPGEVGWWWWGLYTHRVVGTHRRSVKCNAGLGVSAFQACPCICGSYLFLRGDLCVVFASSRWWCGP